MKARTVLAVAAIGVTAAVGVPGIANAGAVPNHQTVLPRPAPVPVVPVTSAATYQAQVNAQFGAGSTIASQTASQNAVICSPAVLAKNPNLVAYCS